MIKPVIVLTHASFSEERHIAMTGLMSDLKLEAPGIPVHLQDDWDRKGSLWCWREGHLEAIRKYPDATHLLWLPDDAIVCKDFGKIIRACIKARPEDIFDCYVNKDIDDEIGTHLWWTCVDGYTGMAGVIPVNMFKNHIRWRDEHPELGNYPNDAGVNLWAQTRRLPIYKTAWSLVTHNHELKSLDGHGDQGKQGIERVGLRHIARVRAGVSEDIMNFLGRTYMAPEDQAPGYASRAIHLDRVYSSNHGQLLFLNPPDIKSYYWAQRHGRHVSRDPLVYIAIPNQGSIKADVATSIVAETNHLTSNGVGCQLNLSVRDSLITRARDRLVANFMASQATHLLFWDSDIVPTEPGFIKKLLDTGLPLVGGAAPFKNETRHVVCVPDNAFFTADGQFDAPMLNGCVEVKCIGSGIMMFTRDVIGRMCEAHPELKYKCHVPGIIDRWEFALFQDSVRDYDRLSEDWNFCIRWRDMGEHVYVHPGLEFTHVGEKAYSGSFNGQWQGQITSSQ